MAENTKSKWVFDKDERVLTVSSPSGIHKASFNLNDIPEEMEDMTLAYGLKQKLSDSTARSKDEKLTEKEAIAEMQETFNQIVSGVWSQKAGGGFSVKKKVAAALDSGALSEKELETLKALLAKTGVTI